MLYSQDGYRDEALRPTQVDERSWEKSKSNRDYSEASDPDKIKAETPDFNPDLNIDGLAWLKYPIIILLAALVVFVLVKIIGGKRNTTVSKTKITLQDLDEIEDDLREAGLDSLLERALGQGEYRMAIRILYLMILRDMDEMSWITFRKDKTNFNYVMELGSRPERRPFTDLTKRFEIIWYGDGPFSEGDYQEISRIYQDYLQNLKNHVD